MPQKPLTFTLADIDPPAPTVAPEPVVFSLDEIDPPALRPTIPNSAGVSVPDVLDTAGRPGARLASRVNDIHLPTGPDFRVEVVGRVPRGGGASWEPEATAAPPRTWTEALVTDPLIDVAQGVIGLGESAVGALDLPTFGLTGGALEKGFGYDPKLTRQVLSTYYSKKRQQSEEKFQQADGMLAAAKVLLEDPALATGSIIQSLPLMAGGAGVARSLVARGLSPLAAGAVGEGVVGAGSAAEGTRQEGEGILTPTQVGLSVASGAGTAVIARVAGRLAQKLGIEDVDTLIAGGTTSPKAQSNLLRQILLGAIQEGVVEELPQSVWEQALSNVSAGRDVLEGLPQAALMGVVSGAVMGGGAQAVRRGLGARTPTETPAGAVPPPAEADAIGPSPSSPGVLTPSMSRPVESRARAVPAVPEPVGTAAPPVTSPVTLPPEFVPVGGEPIVPRGTQPVAVSDEPLTGTVAERAAAMRAENPAIDREAAAMAERARAARTPAAPASEPDFTPIGEKPEGVSHKYSSTQLNLPEPVAREVTALSSLIPEDDLAEGGVETEPHVTVKYGLKDADPTEVARLLRNHPPVMVTLGKTAHFAGVEDGTADAVYAEVSSPELRSLNKFVAENTYAPGDTHRDYKPHVTLAYVKPGIGAKYDGDTTLEGTQVVIDRVVFSSKDGQKYEIPLRGKRDAIETRQQPESRQPEYQDPQERGQTTEAGRGDSPVESGQEPAQAVAPKVRRTYDRNVDQSPRVKKGEVTLPQAFIMQWLADDLREIAYQPSARMRGEQAQDVTEDAKSQEEARRAVYMPRQAGTPTQQMFAALGVTKGQDGEVMTRPTLANYIENYLGGFSRSKAADAAKAIARVYEAAYNPKTRRFDWAKVPDALYAETGLTAAQMRAPMSGPANMDHPLARQMFTDPNARLRRRSDQIRNDPRRREMRRMAADRLRATKEDDSFDVTALETQEDTNEFGEAQPRLPGAADVRDRETATPEIAAAPFSLTAEVGERGSVQAGLFGSGTTGDTTTLTQSEGARAALDRVEAAGWEVVGTEPDGTWYAERSTVSDAMRSRGGRERERMPAAVRTALATLNTLPASSVEQALNAPRARRDTQRQAPQPQPFSAESIAEATGITVRQGQVQAALLEAMGIDPSQVEVVRGGDRGDDDLAQVDTDSPEFRRWFGDSKVTDDRGRPLIVYHATNKDFAAFDPDLSDLGAHFGTTEQASDIAHMERPGERTMPVYLSIEKPLRLRDMGSFNYDRVLEQLVERGMVSPRRADEIHREARKEKGRRLQATKKVREIIEAAGYDGVVYLNREEGTTASQGDRAEYESLSDRQYAERFNARDSWIAFKPTQIKSAIANRGTFDPDAPSILAQKAVVPFRVAPVEFRNGRMLVSTRLPWAKKPPDAKQLLRSDLDAAKNEPPGRPGVKPWLERAADVVRNYPQIRPDKRTDAATIIEEFIRVQQGNLRFLWNAWETVFPDGKALRERAGQWYVGAKRISERLADRYDMTDEATAGVLAILSPNKDWFMNVALAERTIHVVKRVGGANLKITDKVLDAFAASTRRRSEDVLRRLRRQGLIEQADKLEQAIEDDIAAVRHRMVGRRWNELDEMHKAYAVRAIDDAYNTPNYQVITPDGHHGDIKRNRDNKTPSVLTWQSYNFIAQAVSIIEDPSPENIHQRIGQEHKVRSFFNNISDPDYDGAVTVDTHAVGANLLQAVSSDDPEVLAVMKGIGSASTGLSGVNALYGEAYFRLARDLSKETGRHVPPREVQSVTWEMVRLMFPRELKNDALRARVKNEWDAYNRGMLAANDARQRILADAGQIGRPDWADTPARVAGDEGVVRAGDVRTRPAGDATQRRAPSRDPGRPARQRAGRPDGLLLESTDVLYQEGPVEIRAADTRTGWYFDNILTSLASLRQNKVTPQQLLAHLAKVKGATAQADAIGLNAWLKGKKTVLVSEVEDFVRSNRITVQETTLREPSEAEIDAERDKFMEKWAEDELEAQDDQPQLPAIDVRENTEDYDGAAYELYIEDPDSLDGWELVEAFDTEDEALLEGEKLAQKRYDRAVKDRLIDIRNSLDEREADWEVRDRLRTQNAPEYDEDYVLPGGKNYREILLRLPPSHDLGTFRSGHFGRFGNILAWARVNDRVIGGKKVLFVEEIQSDWHHQGRESGYRKNHQIEGHSRGWWEAETERRWRAAQDYSRPKHRNELDNDPEWTRLNKDYDAARETVWAFERLDDGKVLDAPFKGSGWVELAAKRVLAMAADEGYDAVAWTTGQQQSDRYDLAQRVEMISALPGDIHNTARIVDVVLVGGDRISLDVDANGIVVHGSAGDQYDHVVNSLLRQPLSAVVGKDLAQKLMTTDTVVQGEGLRVGGAGMRAFYDEQLPNVFKDLLRKDGARPEVRNSQIPEHEDLPYPNQRPTRVVHHERYSQYTIEFDDGHREGLYNTKAEAEEQFRRKVDEWTRSQREDIGQPVHYVELPATFKTRVQQQGLPLFQGVKGSVEFLSNGKALIRGFENADFSTGIHEIAHVARRFLFNRDVPAAQRRGITDEDIATAERWAGVENGRWTRKAEEKFARGFERYLREGGHAVPKDLRQVFRAIQEWLSDVYDRIKGSEIDINITPEMRQVFDRLVTRKQRLADEQAAVPVERPRGDERPHRGDGTFKSNTEATVPKLAGVLASIEKDAVSRLRTARVLYQGGDEARLPLEANPDVVTVGTVAILRGANTFDEFTTAMVNRFGDKVRPDLKRLWADSATRAQQLRDFDPDDYFNFRRVQLGDAEKEALIQQVVETVIATGRVPKEKVTFDEIRAEAQALHPDAVKHLAAFQQAQAPYRAVRDAARHRINVLNKEIMEDRAKLPSLGLQGDELLMAEDAIGKKEADVRALLDTWMRMRSEDGRNLAMHRMMADSSERWADHAYWLAKAKRAMGLPPGVDLPSHVYGDLRKILQKGHDAVVEGKDPQPVQQELALYMTKLEKTGWLEALATLRKAGLLTGIKTHLRNIAGNASFQMLEELARVPAVVIDFGLAAFVTGQRSVDGVSRRAVTRSMHEAATRGVKEAAEVWRHGATAEERARHGMPKELNTGVDWLDWYGNHVFRTLSASDRVFKAYAFRRSIEEQAALMAINEGRSPIEILAKPTESMIAEAIAAAEFATFNNPNFLAEGLRKMQADWRRANPAGRAAAFTIDILIPFANTPANLIARMFDYTPVGATFRAGSAVYKAVANKALTKEQQRAFSLGISRGMVGSGLMYLGWQLAAAGLMTGSAGDEEPADRAVREAAGRTPGSILIDGVWHQVNAFSPLGNIVTLGASLQRQSTKGLADELKRPAKQAAVLGRLAMEQPMLRGLSDLSMPSRTPWAAAKAWRARLSAASFQRSSRTWPAHSTPIAAMRAPTACGTCCGWVSSRVYRASGT
jgi:2'-5' RNA ligase